MAAPAPDMEQWGFTGRDDFIAALLRDYTNHHPPKTISQEDAVHALGAARLLPLTLADRQNLPRYTLSHFKAVYKAARISCSNRLPGVDYFKDHVTVNVDLDSKLEFDGMEWLLLEMIYDKFEEVVKEHEQHSNPQYSRKAVAEWVTARMSDPTQYNLYFNAVLCHRYIVPSSQALVPVPRPPPAAPQQQPPIDLGAMRPLVQQDPQMAHFLRGAIMGAGAGNGTSNIGCVTINYNYNHPAPGAGAGAQDDTVAPAPGAGAGAQDDTVAPAWAQQMHRETIAGQQDVIRSVNRRQAPPSSARHARSNRMDLLDDNNEDGTGPFGGDTPNRRVNFDNSADNGRGEGGLGGDEDAGIINKADDGSGEIVGDENAERDSQLVGDENAGLKNETSHGGGDENAESKSEATECSNAGPLVANDEEQEPDIPAAHQAPVGLLATAAYNALQCIRGQPVAPNNITLAFITDLYETAEKRGLELEQQSIGTSELKKQGEELWTIYQFITAIKNALEAGESDYLSELLDLAEERVVTSTELQASLVAAHDPWKNLISTLGEAILFLEDLGKSVAIINESESPDNDIQSLLMPIAGFTNYTTVSRDTAESDTIVVLWKQEMPCPSPLIAKLLSAAAGLGNPATLDNSGEIKGPVLLPLNEEDLKSLSKKKRNVGSIRFKTAQFTKDQQAMLGCFVNPIILDSCGLDGAGQKLVSVLLEAPSLKLGLRGNCPFGEAQMLELIENAEDLATNTKISFMAGATEHFLGSALFAHATKELEQKFARLIALSSSLEKWEFDTGHRCETDESNLLRLLLETAYKAAINKKKSPDRWNHLRDTLIAKLACDNIAHVDFPCAITRVPAGLQASLKNAICAMEFDSSESQATFRSADATKEDTTKPSAKPTNDTAPKNPPDAAAGSDGAEGLKENVSSGTKPNSEDMKLFSDQVQEETVPGALHRSGRPDEVPNGKPHVPPAPRRTGRKRAPTKHFDPSTF